MSNIDRDVDLAKRAKIIEWLKTELVDQMAHLLKGIWKAVITESLTVWPVSLPIVIFSAADLASLYAIWMRLFWTK